MEKNFPSESTPSRLESTKLLSRVESSRVGKIFFFRVDSKSTRRGSESTRVDSYRLRGMGKSNNSKITGIDASC